MYDPTDLSLKLQFPTHKDTKPLRSLLLECSKYLHDESGYLKKQKTKKSDSLRNIYALHFVGAELVSWISNQAIAAQKLFRLSLSKAALFPLTVTWLTAALVLNP